tara:strand:- start:1252 stop:2979 length:1728 start_codon:yes stop_codon:yes gene_type:complete
MLTSIKSFLSFILLLGSLSFLGQNFTATVDKSSVQVGERFSLEFVILTQAKNFTPPLLNGFRVLSGPNQGQSTNWINGVVTKKTTLSYVLSANKEGKLTIGSATISTNSGNVKTDPIIITVKKLTEAERRNASRKYIYLKATVSRTNLYVGEQLSATYKLYTKVNIQKHEFSKNPDLTGFWNKEFENKSEGKTQIINGEQWTVYQLKKVILIPQQSGELFIDPFKMDFVVEKPSKQRSFFSRGESVNLQLSSNPITINVKALPVKAPSSFAGAVGEFSLSGTVNKNEVKANDGIDYKIKISGRGNFHLFGKPETHFPEDFEVYDPKISNNYKVRTSGTKGNKEWNFLVIPRFGGDFTISPVEFTYFSPKKKKYITLKTKQIIIKVAKGTAEETVTFRGQSNKQDVKDLDQTIRYIHTSSADLNRSSKSWFGTWLHYLLLACGPVLFIVGFLLNKQSKASNKDIAGTRRKKANKTASKYLKEAREKKSDKSAFYELLGKALYGYLSDKLSIPLSVLNQENIKGKLIEVLPEDDVNSLIETLDYCEMAKYSPMTSIDEEELLKNSEVIINQIESVFH